jgi:hypothetical protein
VTRLLLLAGFCVACVSPQARPGPLAASADSLRAADTAAVLVLGRQFGIPQPARIERVFPALGGCPAVELGSPVNVEGNRRSWMELTVRRRGRDTGGHRCEVYAPSGSTVKRSDRWVASSEELIERSLWRVSDGDWNIDVTLDPGVPYDSAVVLVLAVRRRALVNGMPAGLRRLFGDTLPTIDASDIRTIRRRQDVYQVITGERWGTVLSVSIVAGEVIVRNVGSWIS